MCEVFVLRSGWGWGSRNWSWRDGMVEFCQNVIERRVMMRNDDGPDVWMK